MIREMKKSLGENNRERIRCLEAKEIDPGAVGIAFPDVGSEIQFGKTARTGNAGHPAQLNSIHPEWNHAHPGRLIECIYLKTAGEQRL
jgi:hypothetical protein